MFYGYIRVSTDKQTVENQRYEIEQYCLTNNIKIDKYIEETISGTKSYRKRQLGRLLGCLTKGDTIIASELSRFGRSLFMVMEILSVVMKKECSIITIKDHFHLNDDIESKVLAFAFSLSAEIERKLISQRTKEALLRIKSEGRSLGRPKGSKKLHPKLEGKEELINKYLLQKRKKTYIARRLKVHPNTIYAYLRHKKENNK